MRYSVRQIRLSAVDLFLSVLQKRGNEKNAFNGRIDRIYELNAHESHHRVVIKSGETRDFLRAQSFRVGGASVRNHGGKINGR